MVSSTFSPLNRTKMDKIKALILVKFGGGGGEGPMPTESCSGQNAKSQLARNANFFAWPKEQGPTKDYTVGQVTSSRSRS